MGKVFMSFTSKLRIGSYTMVEFEEEFKWSRRTIFRMINRYKIPTHTEVINGRRKLLIDITEEYFGYVKEFEMELKSLQIK